MQQTQPKLYSAAKHRFIRSEKKKISQSYFKQKRFQLTKQVNPLGALTFLNNEILCLFNYALETINVNELQNRLQESIKFISQNIEKSYQFAKAVQKQQILQKMLIILLKTIKLNQIYRQEHQNPQNQQGVMDSQIQIEVNFELDLQQTVVSNSFGHSLFDRKMIGRKSLQIFMELLLKLTLINKGQKQYYQVCYKNFKNQLEQRLSNRQICLQYFQISLLEKKRESQFSSLFQMFLSKIVNILQTMLLDFCNMDQPDLVSLVIQVLVEIDKVSWIDRDGWRQILHFIDQNLLMNYENNSQQQLLSIENTKKIHNLLLLLKRNSSFQSNNLEEQCIWRLFFVQIKWMIAAIDDYELYEMQKLICQYLPILKQFSIIDKQVIEELKQLLQILICKFVRQLFRVEKSNNFSYFHKNSIWRQTFLEQHQNLKLFCQNIQTLVQILYAQLSLELQQLEKIKNRVPFLKNRINQIIEHDL